MIEALITPNENRSLSQTNWILVRIWKVCYWDRNVVLLISIY